MLLGPRVTEAGMRVTKEPNVGAAIMGLQEVRQATH
jgi:hypothetical protein